MTEIAGLAKTLQDYGIYAIASALFAAVVILYREVRALEAARLADQKLSHAETTALLTKSIENDKDQAHAMLALTEVIKGRANV
jgi:hypothetical protein